MKKITIERRKRKIAQLPNSIAEEYRNGARLLDLVIKYKTSMDIIRQKLVLLRVRIRDAGTRKGQMLVLTKEQVKWLLEQDMENVPHADIARQLNISRERVRQISLESGHKTRTERRQYFGSRNVIKRDIVTARSISNKEWIRKISDLWISGARLSYLQKIMNLASIGGMMNQIRAYRRQFGEKLFPFRRPDHWTRQKPKEVITRKRLLMKLHDNGFTNSEIAYLLNYKDAKATGSMIRQLRNRMKKHETAKTTT